MTCSFAAPALFPHSLHHLLLTVQLKVYQSPKNDHSGCNSTLPPLHCIIWSAPSLRLGPTSGGSRENFWHWWVLGKGVPSWCVFWSHHTIRMVCYTPMGLGRLLVAYNQSIDSPSITTCKIKQCMQVVVRSTDRMRGLKSECAYLSPNTIENRIIFIENRSHVLSVYWCESCDDNRSLNVGTKT